MKGSHVIQRTFQRPGPAPQLSEREVITLALSQERTGEPREDHVFRGHQASVLPCFPGLNERSRYHRRTRDLWSVILAIRVSVQMVLDTLALEDTAVSDAAQAPCVGDTREQRHSDVQGMADDGVCRRKALTPLTGSSTVWSV